jgi:hypothetical protein
MLVLNRRPANAGWRHESEIVVTVPPSDKPTEVRFQVLEVRESQTVRVGVSAPKECPIMRPDATVQWGLEPSVL